MAWENAVWSVLGGALIGAGLVLLLGDNERAPHSSEINDDLQAKPQTLQGFSLIDHERREFGSSDLSGRWTVLLFGFTHCPDVCPATLSRLKLAMQMLTRRDPDVPTPQVVFVSVDPNRDRPRKLKTYVSYFDPAFIGVTGTGQALARLEEQLDAAHGYGPGYPTGAYSVEHSSDVYLIDPDARVRAKFQQPLYPETFADQFLSIASKSIRSHEARLASG